MQLSDSRPAAVDTLPQGAEMDRLIVKNLVDYAIFTTDAEGLISGWAQAAERIFGYPESEVINRSISLIFTAEDVATGILAQELEKALTTGSAVEIERWFIRRDGSAFWAIGKIIPRKDAGETGGHNDKVGDTGESCQVTRCGLIWMLRDATIRKTAETQLEQSNQRLETLLSSISDSFYTFDRDFRYVRVNEATTRMFGLSKTEFLGKHLSELFPDVEGNIFHREIKRSLREQTPIVFENYYAPLDRWFENRAYPSPDGLSIFTTEITDRKRAEAALRESEESYRTLFDSIDEGFCLIEVLFDAGGKANDYRFLEMNPSFEKLTGINAVDALSGKTVLELVPELEEKWFEIYGRVALTGEPIRFVEGSEAMNRWFDVYAFGTGEAESRRCGILFNNVTERKQSEMTLRLAEERYRALIEATATTVWHASPDGALTFVGERWREVTGQSIEEILKWSWLESLHPDDREPTSAAWSKALKEKSVYSTEFRVLTVSGEYRWFAVSAVPIFDSAGNLREWVGTNTDITIRKRAEEERAEVLKQLRIERSQLTYIFENAPAFVTVLRGPEHVFELTNPAYLQLIGHRDVIGKTVIEALPEVKGQGFIELLDKVYQTGKAFTGSAISLDIQREPQGELEKRFLDFVYQPIFGEGGQVSGIFVHGVDITEQVMARQAADNANSLKDEFLATLSHELRTPLNAILGWSQILQNRNLDEAQKEQALATIERNARAQNQLIDDILDVSRIITGKLRLDVGRVDLQDVILAVIEAAQPAVDAKGIRLQTLLDPQAGPISGDPDRLQQVIWNLLSNAIKFTSRGGRVQMRLERVNSNVEITVSDTGKGIDQAFLAHVFDRFRQSDGSMTRRHGGLGLGLAITRQLVELHGGTIIASSPGLDQGSIFTVSLPLLPLRAETAGGDPRTHPKFDGEEDTEGPESLANLRILVVDDEADSRDLLNAILNSCGAQVTQAASAAEAFEQLAREKFDLIISDIGMPEEDGFSLISKIRELPAAAGGHIPAIALTAYASSETRVRALRLGFQMHLTKPVETLELITVISSLAERIQ